MVKAAGERGEEGGESVHIGDAADNGMANKAWHEVSAETITGTCRPSGAQVLNQR